jgi:signal transduction histidine kinase
MTLRAKLLTLFAVLGVVPILALGVLNYARSMQGLERLLQSRTGAIAQGTADAIRELYAQRQSDLLLLAGNAETQSLFRARADGASAAWHAALASADPYLRRAWEVVGSPYQWMELRDATGSILYALGSHSGPAADVVEVRQPIRSLESSGDLGTLVTALHLRAILPRQWLDTTFGQEGYSVVLDRDGDLILHHPVRAFVQQRRSRLLGPEGWRVDPAVLAKDSGAFTFEEGRSRRVASFVSLASPSWTVICTASLDEFAAPFARSRTLNLVLVVLISAPIAVAFYLLTRRATRSLEYLTMAADAVARGDFAPRLPAPGRDEVGRLSSAFGVMATEVRDMVRRIEQSRHLAAIGRFASQLSHEVRNPLTSIKLNLQSLERAVASGRIPSDFARPVEICLREVSRLDRVVRGALSLAQTPRARLEPCSIHACVEETLDVLRPQLEKGEIAIERDLGASRDQVLGDAERLKGVFLNLLLNSIDAMPGGGTIRISTDTTDSTIRIRLRDEGPGVPPDLRDRIFEPFFSTKPEGTGLGLPVSSRIIHRHKGILEFESKPGKGTIFRIVLPANERGE